MDTITATELQLLECFGVEPKLLDPNDPWCYNDALYVVEVDGFSISFAIQPAYRDVRIVVSCGEKHIFELNAVGVADIRVIDETGVDAAEVRLDERSWLRLQLRPVFEMTQSFREQQSK
jgi:hypothetical protein